MDDTGLYLYCIAEGARTGAQVGPLEERLNLTGVGGSDVLAFAARGFTAVLQECASPFSSEDEAVVAGWVESHHTIVAAAWRRYGTVIPFGFDTIVVASDGKSARENLTDWLDASGKELEEKIERLEGKAEYGIQISWDTVEILPRLLKNDRGAEEITDQIQSSGPGTAYLLNRKRDEMLRKRVEMAADAYFKEFHARISGLASAIEVEAVKREDLPRQMILNASCLAGAEEAARIGEELDRIQKIAGFFVRFTGPWPPYSFVR